VGLSGAAAAREVPTRMEPDDHVCICFRVSLRKLVNHMSRERPAVASQLADCLGAGTGCHWCVPFLRRLHSQWTAGQEPNLPVSPQDYALRRTRYHRIGRRDAAAERGE
jgi:NAD(P)H-nitrite reductase large subunit